MASNALTYDPSAQESLYNLLAPSSPYMAYGSDPGMTNVNVGTTPISPAAPTNYPAWLTDLSARGIASDWAPAAQVVPDVPPLDSRVIPDAVDTAPTTPAQTAPIIPDVTGGADGAGGAGGAGNGAEAGGGPGASGGDSSGGDAGADAGGAGGDSGGEGGGYSKGGMVVQNRLIGPNPRGPDTGYAALKAGEGVITSKAMKFYGPKFLAQVNKLAVPKLEGQKRA